MNLAFYFSSNIEKAHAKSTKSKFFRSSNIYVRVFVSTKHTTSFFVSFILAANNATLTLYLLAHTNYKTGSRNSYNIFLFFFFIKNIFFCFISKTKWAFDFYQWNVCLNANASLKIKQIIHNNNFVVVLLQQHQQLHHHIYVKVKWVECAISFTHKKKRSHKNRLLIHWFATNCFGLLSQQRTKKKKTLYFF